MSEKKSLLYFLFGENPVPLYRDVNGVVRESDGNWKKPDGNAAHLEFDPNGFKDTVWKYARNPTVWGVLRDYTVPLNFVEDGREILRYIVWSFGREGKCRLGILKLDRSVLPYTYNNVYLSEVNFAKYVESKTDAQVEALEGGPSKFWKANESEKYTIPVDANPNHVRLYNDGQAIKNTATFSVLDGIDPNAEFRNHLVNLLVVQREINIGGVFDVPRTQVANNNTTIKNTGFFLMNATTAGVMKAEWNFTLRIDYTPAAPALNPAAVITCVLRVIHKDGTAGGLILFTRDQSLFAFPIVNKTYVVTGNGNVNVVEGDELYLYTFCSITGATGDAQLRFVYGGDEPTFKLGYEYRHPASYMTCLTPLELGKQLVSKMSDGECDLVSNFLTNLNILYAPADAVRGLPNSEMIISWKEFYQSLQQFGVMMYFDGNNFRIESFDTAFQDGIAYNLGAVKNAKLKFAEDICFNKIKNGFPTESYGEINGRLEFNQPQEWGLPITKTVKELDLSSPVRGDAFGAEILRINFEGKTTTDSSSDNDNFMFAAKRNNQYEQYIAEEKIVYSSSFALYQIPFATSRVGQNFAADTSFTKFTYTGSAKQQVNIEAQVQVFKADGSQVSIQILRNTDIIGIRDVVADGTSKTVDANISIDPKDVLTVQVVQVSGVVDSEVTYAKLTVTFNSTYVYILDRPNFTSITGVEGPSVYNVQLRPKQAILNNGAMIHSICENFLDGKLIKFNSGEGNTDLTTILNGVTMNEKEDIPIKSLNPILFRPWYITFTTDINVNFFTILKSNPYQRISFQWNGKTCYGFIWDGGVKIATEDSQDWVLLAAPETDLRNFNL